MKKIITLSLFFITTYCNAQLILLGVGAGVGAVEKEIAKKKEASVKYTYTYIVDGNDSIRCRRTPDEERKKLPYDKSSANRTAEESLDEYKKCLNMHYTKILDDGKSVCQNKRSEAEMYIKAASDYKVNITDYENELNYYERVEEKKINEELLIINEEQLKIERDTEVKDSIAAVNARQKEISDSLEVINDNKNKLNDLIKRFGKTNGTNLYNHDFKLGMTKEMCVYVLGQPDHKAMVQTVDGVRETLAYNDNEGNFLTLVFTNDKLVLIQK